MLRRSTELNRQIFGGQQLVRSKLACLFLCIILFGHLAMVSTSDRMDDVPSGIQGIAWRRAVQRRGPVNEKRSTTAQTNTTCDQPTLDAVQACLDQVERDEADPRNGPCGSDAWRCICTKQQGMVDCYTACPSLMPLDQQRFDRDNCAGQHQGLTLNALGGDLMYTWSDLNVALAGAKGSGGVHYPPNTTTAGNTTANDASGTAVTTVSSLSTADGQNGTALVSQTNGPHGSYTPNPSLWTPLACTVALAWHLLLSHFP